LRWYEKWLPRRRPVSLYEVDYFLPDLCRGEGLLAVIVISLLLSVLIAVARSGIENFDWPGFGNIAFMAIWIALLSVLVLCECNRWLIGVRYTWSAAISFGLVLAVAFVVGVAADYVVAWSLGGVFGFGRALNVVVVTAIPGGHSVAVSLLAAAIAHPATRRVGSAHPGAAGADSAALFVQQHEHDRQSDRLRSRKSRAGG